MKLQFGKAERSGRVVFELQGGRLEVPGRVLIDGAELWIERGEHVSLVGPNGTGKTTLIRALVGERPLDGGRLATGHNVKIGYLSQHAEELGDVGSVLDACQRQTGLTPNKARALLGKFLFSGEQAEKPVAGLSGGERRRLSLAVLVASGANVLVIDEPTNHLDIESREALEDALHDFEGALILVSHDRALLDAVGTRTVAVEGGTLRSYEGGWAEYLRVREERKARGEDPWAQTPIVATPPTNGAAKKAATAAPAPAPSPAPKKKGPSRNALKEQDKLQKAVEDAEAALTTVEQELAGPGAWATKYDSAKSEAKHTSAKRAVEAAYAAWEEHSAKVEAAAAAE
jgi:ATP-binding cassette subfamily F protein 3